MQTQMVDAAGSTTRREVRATGWQGRAVEEHERFLLEKRSRLRTALAARLLGLTGIAIALEDLYVDAFGHFAGARVNGERFRLYHRGDLALVRPCSYCGTGNFESPRIIDRVDLGYALLAWHPLHQDCEDYDASMSLTDW
jgi:hypothetical protein